MAKPTYPAPGNEYAPIFGGKAPVSVPPPGQSVISNAVSPITGRYEVFRDGVKIAVCKTQFHANEVSGHAALAYPNPNPFTLRNQITSFEAPPGT